MKKKRLHLILTGLILTVMTPFYGQQIIHTIPAPGVKCQDVAWDGSDFWTNDFDQDLIFKQDPYTGDIIGSINMPVNNMRGMSWDGNYLWMANWQAQQIYQVDVGPLHAPELDEKTSCFYPNPGSGLFYFKESKKGNEPILILITDITGKVLKQFKIDSPDGDECDAEIDLREFKDGIYLIKINDSGEMSQHKIILKR